MENNASLIDYIAKNTKELYTVNIVQERNLTQLLKKRFNKNKLKLACFRRSKIENTEILKNA